MIINTELAQLLRNNNTSEYINFKLNDNEQAHQIINDIIRKLIERISKLEEAISQNIAPRLDNLEKFATSELIGPQSLQYKPQGKKDYLTLGENLDLLYDRLNRLEDVIYSDGK